MPKYYDGSKLLRTLDINGEKPEIYICTSNRSAGKSTWFNRYVFQRWLDAGEKFCLVYRFITDMSDVAAQFFDEIRRLFFPDYIVESEPVAGGAYHVLKCDGDPCGYAVALNSADKIKRHSHRLADVACMIFDEFQSENGQYAPNEVNKFKSLHVSIARGGGEQSRYVPVYMISNPISLINPYYVELGVADRLQRNTRFLRGEGWVLEQGYNESAAQAQKESAFNRAFGASGYIAYASEGKYLLDQSSAIEKQSGKSQYLCTICYGGKEYGIRRYPETGIVYCSKSVDKTAPIRIATTTDDMATNYVALSMYPSLIQALRYYFNRGAFRFSDAQSRTAVFRLLSY